MISRWTESDLRRTELTLLFFFQAEDGIRDGTVTGVQTCALPIFLRARQAFDPCFGARSSRPIAESATINQFHRAAGAGVFGAQRGRVVLPQPLGQIHANPGIQTAIRAFEDIKIIHFYNLFIHKPTATQCWQNKFFRFEQVHLNLNPVGVEANSTVRFSPRPCWTWATMLKVFCSTIFTSSSAAMA